MDLFGGSRKRSASLHCGTTAMEALVDDSESEKDPVEAQKSLNRKRLLATPGKQEKSRFLQGESRVFAKKTLKHFFAAPTQSAYATVHSMMQSEWIKLKQLTPISNMDNLSKEDVSCVL